MWNDPTKSTFSFTSISSALRSNACCVLSLVSVWFKAPNNLFRTTMKTLKMNEYWSFRLNPLTGWFGINCSCLTECHSNWEGPCFGMTVQKCPRLGGLCRGWAVPFFRGQTDTTAQQPFVPALLKRCGLFIVYFLFHFVYSAPVSTSISFIPLFFPHTMSHHLLSLALFVSWHAECCQPITDTRCLFISISKNRKTLQFFILLCAICPRFHITEHDAFNRACGSAVGNVPVLSMGLYLTRASVMQKPCGWVTNVLFFSPVYFLFHYFSVSPRKH